ncbi:MAG: radical SAM protein [Candidatus Sabulitectum sp.]|nr:radical SAM protein [Candidatus Sabulitectum sp.]
MENKYLTLTVNDANIHLGPDKSFLKFRNQLSNPPEILAINDSAAEILLRSNGTRTVSEIANELSTHYTEKYRDVLPKVNRFIKSFMSTGYLSLSDNPKIAKVRVTGSREYLVPLHAAIELTTRCNLRCKHCYNSSSPDSGEVMSLERVIELFDILKSWGVGAIELSGGEPLTHPDIKNILTIAHEYFGLVGVITNGVLLKSEHVDVMKNGTAHSLIQIDLDGSDPEYVNWFRGQDNVYEREIQAIKRVVESGLLLRVAMIVTPGNIDQMESTASLVKSLGANSFGMSLVVPQGRALIGDANLMLSPQEAKNYIAMYKKLAQRYEGFIFEEIESKFNMANEGNCGVGSRSISIAPNGNVKMCQMSDESIYFFGNIFDNSCRELFEQSSQSLALVEAPSDETCGNCVNSGYCRGCINRGVIKAKEISPENCSWIQQYVSVFMEN